MITRVTSQALNKSYEKERRKCFVFEGFGKQLSILKCHR